MGKMDDVIAMISKKWKPVKAWFNPKTGYLEIRTPTSYLPIAKIKVRGEMGDAEETEICIPSDFPEELKTEISAIVPKKIATKFLPIIY